MDANDAGPTGPIALRRDRRQVLRLGLAAPVISVAAALGHHGLDILARAASGASSATPGGTPISCASPISASPAATPDASPTAAVTVKMTTQLRFEPTDVTIRVGETVTWRNDGPIPHTATDNPAQNPVATSRPEYAQLPPGAAPWNSGLLQPGQTFSHAFTVAGEYRYFCIPHVLSGMRGTITVIC